jgi:hypothetical protein
MSIIDKLRKDRAYFLLKEEKHNQISIKINGNSAELEDMLVSLILEDGEIADMIKSAVFRSMMPSMAEDEVYKVMASNVKAQA